jgi:endo-beta-N-acetylglucosaminidase D
MSYSLQQLVEDPSADLVDHSTRLVVPVLHRILYQNIESVLISSFPNLVIMALRIRR